MLLNPTGTGLLDSPLCLIPWQLIVLVVLVPLFLKVERFGAIDNQIRNSRSYFGRRDDSNKVDRYGKKYSLIAYHEMHGLLGALRHQR